MDLVTAGHDPGGGERRRAVRANRCHVSAVSSGVGSVLTGTGSAATAAGCAAEHGRVLTMMQVREQRKPMKRTTGSWNKTNRVVRSRVMLCRLLVQVGCIHIPKAKRNSSEIHIPTKPPAPSFRQSPKNCIVLSSLSIFRAVRLTAVSDRPSRYKTTRPYPLTLRSSGSKSALTEKRHVPGGNGMKLNYNPRVTARKRLRRSSLMMKERQGRHSSGLPTAAQSWRRLRRQR